MKKLFKKISILLLKYIPIKLKVLKMLISMVYTPTSFLKKKRITEILVPNYLCVLIKFYYFFSYFNFFDVFLHIERISNAQKKSPSFVSLGQIVSNVDLPNPNPAISHVTHDITINMII